MSANPVLWKLDDRGVATVTLNRPEVNNAYDGALIQGVLAAKWIDVPSSFVCGKNGSQRMP